ncbi:putative c6 zinc finger domain protein [Botrytis fragariae]|uniref:Putative c6 zinc finger domain protein n=1 Tax=Botrytis fragariae TaxID=1964551 RepID=A0A8H6AKX2_9HELO|nr:putative c6 zinc finger domain protein [Botrytis fragariae]KAF5869140.1 putative c6 zinc finger domain protein [Botrytis fragariae]
MSILSTLRQSLTLFCFSSKCDEEKPRCQRCVSREITCTYPRLQSLIWVDGPSTPETNSKTSKDSGPSPPAYSSTPQNEEASTSDTKTPSLNLENLDLIIHWFTKTVYTVNPPNNVDAIQKSQTFILREAVEHHFLLHGLLALSALHYAESHPNPQKYIEIATAHHTRGLTLYHSILSNMNNGNDVASIAFSSITAIFAFGLARPDAKKEASVGLIDDMVQAISLSKGWQTIMHVTRGLEPPSPQKYQITLSPDAEAAFDRLYALSQGQNATLYTTAITSLKFIFKKTEDGQNDNPHLSCEWGGSLQEEFLKLLRAKDTVALVIVAFSCVMFEKVPQVWWFQGWSKGLFGVVWREVGHNYHEVLEWPRRIVGFEI